ncbi:DUF5361 domain-containing protein [Enterococcus canintestini]|nr:DUF5361 domain-containing protein [Enterococcus canintestini]
MLRLDEDSLICDLAETYQIYDYRQLPLLKVAVFACGLRENSRIKMKIGDQLLPTNTLLLAGIADRLSLLLWSKTKEAQKGKNRPSLILDNFQEIKSNEKVLIFDSSEEFEQKRKEILQGKRGED